MDRQRNYIAQVEGELVYKILGAAYSVINAVGHGFREKTYERGLCVEFQHLGIPFSQQQVYPVYYRGIKIDEFIPDLEVAGKVILETKVVDCINDDHVGQTLNYLKITGMEVGLILNFRHPRLQHRKIVYQPERPR
ncbi:MAG: GxxExxY protein [Candidatus Hydrogenedentes bacterium]|nr:GxxExxY protein [Candidatus Hydrogenedentota bacterium]